MQNLIIRPVSDKDISCITAIYAYAVKFGSATFEIDPPSEQEMHQRMQSLITHNYPYLVAEFEGQVAGYAYAGSYRPRAAFASTLEDSIYLHQDFQYKGIGYQLLLQLITEATRRNFRQIIAIIGDSANAASISLHKKAGFIHVGVEKSVGWKHQRWLDTVIMQFSLGVGDSKPYP